MNESEWFTSFIHAYVKWDINESNNNNAANNAVMYLYMKSTNTVRQPRYQCNISYTLYKKY